MTHPAKRYFSVLIAGAMAIGTAGCGVVETRDIQRGISNDANARLAESASSRPVFRVHEGAWLMGEKVKASKPQPEIYNKRVEYKGSIASLAEAANYIAQRVGVRATVDASASSQGVLSAAVSATPATGARGSGPVPAGGARVSDLAAPLAATTAQSGSPARTAAPLNVRYDGNLKGFLDILDAHFGVWSRYSDGTVTFFRTETRTYVLPSLADESGMSGSITTADSSSGGGAGSMAGTSGSSAAGSAGRSGQTTTLSVTVKPWESLQQTAKAVSGGAEVVVDKNLGTLTVTGEPPQCDRVEEFVKSLTAMYGKQVAIDVKIYDVRVTREDNYGLNLELAYTNASGHTGVSFNSASAPKVSGSASPMSLGASIMTGPLAGSKAVVQALSTLGNVSQVVARSGVTQNGKVLALQTATLQDYVPQSQTTLAANVGSTSSIQTGSVTYGFTSSFLPKVVDGRILMTFDMTLSDLLPLQPFSTGGSSNQTTVQLRTMPTNRFEQSVTLKPGETLVLTGLRNQKASTTNNGVGDPSMAALGGGVGATRGDTVIAIVISARLL